MELQLRLCVLICGLATACQGYEIKSGNRVEKLIEDYVITEARLREIRRQFLYPFNDTGPTQDYEHSITSMSPEMQKELNFTFPVFGFRYDYFRVSLNGYVDFSDFPNSPLSYPLVFPIKFWPAESDPAFIAPFLSKCRIGSIRDTDVDQRTPGVYVRVEEFLRDRTDQVGVEIRERVKWDVREGIIGATAFDPRHVIIVTWKNVSFAGGLSSAIYKTNTFQMILATDEIFTYVIFNYGDIIWTSHTEAGGDSVTGEGGVPAFVGFNGGNGTRSYEYQSYSQRSSIYQLSEEGFVNGFRGRHIFRIDENILRGSCDNASVGINLPLQIAPESGNMLGGTVVNITGPCFSPNDNITCRFGDELVNGFVVDKNRGICVQPQLFSEGIVRMEISVNGELAKWRTKYFVETPWTSPENVYFKDNSYNERAPPVLAIIWNPSNISLNRNLPVQISLWGFRESAEKPEFLYINSLAENVANTGQFTVDPSSYLNRNDGNLTDIKFGFIQVNATNRDNEDSPRIWSKPIPLAWYFNSQWERLYGEEWPTSLCEEWMDVDKLLPDVREELPNCPCILDHALSDKGRFLPDLNCDKDINPECYYNRMALHCVKSGMPSSNGAEQQCCYDKNKFLMLSADSMYGSSPSRSHNLGISPWDEPGKIPTLSQWNNDIIPKHLCCLWQHEDSDDCYSLRNERRPSSDCISYESPGVGSIFGDPHLVTFDGINYTFNGKGEFVLVKSLDDSPRLEVQGRFQQPSEETKATVLTSVVARGNATTVVEVRLRSPGTDPRYKLEVLVDSRRTYFDNKALKVQHFPGVTVHTPSYIYNQSQVIIMLDSGAGVEVTEDLGYMSATVYLPETFKDRVHGLLGNFNYIKDDDIRGPNGERYSEDDSEISMEQLQSFGVAWRLNETDQEHIGRALFYREFGRTSEFYNDLEFKPELGNIDGVIAEKGLDLDKINAFCKDNIHCKFDYAVSEDEDCALVTNKESNYVAYLQNLLRKKVISCGVLKTPRHGRKSTFLFVPGTIVHFECIEDYTLYGDDSRECLKDGNWNTPVNAEPICLPDDVDPDFKKKVAGKASWIKERVK